MRSNSAILAALLLLGLLMATATPLQSTAAETPNALGSDTCDDIIGCGLPLCDGCGGGIAQGSSLVLAKLNRDGASVQYAYCSLRCLHKALHKLGDGARLDSLSVVDSGSLSEHSDGQLIDGRDAYFVMPQVEPGVAVLLPIPAYASADAAAGLAAATGGTIFHGWDELEPALVAAEDDADQNAARQN
jgi:nitrous oxide reductase accessory protein NosL